MSEYQLEILQLHTGQDRRIWLSIGTEQINDMIADLKTALQRSNKQSPIVWKAFLQ